MLASFLLAATLLAQGGACTSPAISSVMVERTTQDGALNDYQLRINVVNSGGASQAGNVLQSVDIFRNGTKVDQKGVPPLKAGGSYSFVYSFSRNSDAAERSTTFTFRMDPGQSCETYVFRV